MSYVLTEPVSMDDRILVRVRAGTDEETAFMAMLEMAVETGKTIEAEFNGSMFKAISIG